MKKSFFGSILAILIFSIVFFLFPIRDIKALTLDDTDLYIERDNILEANTVIKYNELTEEEQIVKEIVLDTDIPVPTESIWKQGKIIDEDISKRTPNSQTFIRDNQTYIKFYPRKQFIYRDTEWYELEYAESSIEDYNQLEKDIQLISFLDLLTIQEVIAQTTIYSDNGDGAVGYNNNTHTWSTAHPAVTGTVVDSSDTSFNIDATYNGGDSKHIITRGFFPFDTSGLDDHIEIDTAELYLYVTSKLNEDDDSQAYFAVVAPTYQADYENLAVADYDQCNTTDNPLVVSDHLDIGDDISITAYNKWTLTATSGHANIVATGTTLLGVREGHDIEDIAIVVGANVRNRITVSGSEETGTAQDPYLLITEASSTPATSTPEETATTTSSLPCEMKYSTDLSLITSCTEIYESSTTPVQTRYTYYHIPQFVFVLLAFLFMWIIEKLYIQIIARMRIKKLK